MLYVQQYITGSLLTSTSAPLVRRLTAQQTDQQYSYYAKNVKGCLSSEIICVELDILIGLRASPVFQNLT